MRAFLLDIDGTTLLGSEPLAGAVAFTRWLRAEGLPFLWMTNNTSRSRADWLARLEDAGLEPVDDELYTSGDATIAYLQAERPEARIFLVGPAGLRGDFEAAGLHLADEGADTVVLAYDVELTYARIERAAHLLLGGAAYYATHPDVTCPTPQGPIPDVGSFIAMFEAACHRTPTVLGKPEPTMIAGALARLGAEAGETVMVGDRLATDVAMAVRSGLVSCLVRTGVTTDAEIAAAAEPPMHVFDDLAAVHAWARSQRD